jgi:hypothetical protein
MTAPKPGTAIAVEEALRDAKAQFEAAARVEEQMSLLDPVTPEEMVEARDELGPDAGRLSVLKLARERRRGRPKGARNKRTDDFAKYLLQFGRHPAITMMEIQSAQPEILIEASKQEKVHSFSKLGEPRVVIERMTYAEAQSLRLRASEGLMPYFESKKPVAVDVSFNGIGDLVIEGVTHDRQEVQDIVDADFLEVDDDGEDGE